jgi:PqqD family protein of HPr-rel-A system
VGIEWEELDGEVVVYDPLTGTVHFLNATAAAVWAACDGASTVDEIVDRVGATFVIEDTDDVVRGVRGILVRFETLGLLAGAPAPTA